MARLWGDGHPGGPAGGSEDWPSVPEGNLLCHWGRSQVHKGTGARMFIVVLVVVRSCRQWGVCLPQGD